MGFSTFKFNRLVSSPDSNVITREYILVPSAVAGAGYPANGDTVDFTVVTNPKKQARRSPPAGIGRLPANADIKVFMPLGFGGRIKRNTVTPTLKNYLFTMWNNATAAIHATADYVAGLAGEEITIWVTTPKRNG